MGDFLSGAAYLPPSIRDVIIGVPGRIQTATQEIRLRAGAPVVLSTPAGELLVTKSGPSYRIILRQPADLRSASTRGLFSAAL